MRRLGVESYVAVPLRRRDGSVFGTLCALDTVPADIDATVLETFSLLADLVAYEMESEEEWQGRDRAEEERRSFVEAVAHDLKSPLQVIKAQAQMLQRRLRSDRPFTPDHLESRLGEIEASVNRGTELIDEMLDASRIRSGQVLSLNLEETDLARVVRDTVETMQRSSQRHALEARIGEGPLVGCWDRSRVSRVLANLIGNAIRYSDDGPVTVSAGCEAIDGANWAVVRVTDRGIGIPEAELPRVFERYWRGGNVDRQMAGTGIGLAGSRQIVEQHGGGISMESIVGEGSTFTVRLPLA